MANITDYLKKILTARYGRDVRQSIHDSIDAINTQVTECENSAYNSAKSASKSANEAKTSEDNAALSANNAAQSEENAGTSETNAKVSENNAVSYALSASISANNAAQSAADATLLASNAAQSELNAQTSATNAQTSANNAKTYESNTALNAANAQTSADNASTSASNAAQSAADASTSASNAQECYEKSQEIYDNFQSAGSVTGVKGSAEETYRTGQVEITAANVGAAKADDLTAHINNKDNPHNVTAEQIGLGNVLEDLALKLDKKTTLSNTSVNDVWETGIYTSSTWLDSPYSADGQGTLIVFHYIGDATNGWYTQLFISPHYEEIKIRKHASTTYGSWCDIASAYNIKDMQAGSAINDSEGRNIVDTYATEDFVLNQFDRMGLNSIDIDTKRGNWSVGLSNGATADNGWGNIIQFDCDHFITQLGIGCDGNGAVSNIYYRNKYTSGKWSDWSLLSMQRNTPKGGGIEFQIVNGELQYRYDTAVWG